MKFRRANRKFQRDIDWCKCQLIVLALAAAVVDGQDISTCCSRATGACRSVCEKVSLSDKPSTYSMNEEKLQSIYKFCAPHLIEFWICMNQTIQEVVSGSEWWGRTCCGLGRSSSCRNSCLKASHPGTLSSVCRRSDEMPFFDCVQKQQEAQWCCSQTQSFSCHELCHKHLFRIGEGHLDRSVKDRLMEECEQSPPLLQCLKTITESSVHTDVAKYLPCCQESPSPTCRESCEEVLGRSGESQLIAEHLSNACGEPALHDAMWQCILRKDSPVDTKDLIPHDVPKLHCCHKASTLNCKRLCHSTFSTGWQTNWQSFYSECLGNPQEIELTQCVEEVEAPCTLGCNGLTYCSHLNNHPTSLFRSCTKQADMDAHLAVAEQIDTGKINLAGTELPLRNTSNCKSHVWKKVACALHVKPCSNKGHSSLLCMEDCMRLVTSCIDWSRIDSALNARSLCARLTPKSIEAPCISLDDFAYQSTHPVMLSPLESITSPCSNAVCNESQICVVNRKCLRRDNCEKYTCVDGCPLGSNSNVVVPLGSWSRVVMPGDVTKACYKVCRCHGNGLSECQPLPCVNIDGCRVQNVVIPHGREFSWLGRSCRCSFGSRECSWRISSSTVRMPCSCPTHHLPAMANGRLYPNACLAKCAGATDAEIEFAIRAPCENVVCPKSHVCLPKNNVCMSRLQAKCPQYQCVNISGCANQPFEPVCDSDGRTHPSACHLVRSGRRFAYWGDCLQRCNKIGQVCGVNGVTYQSECSAWSELVTIDYPGPCFAVGPISDSMQPKCHLDRINCPPLKRENCLGFTAPGSCCPKCGGAMRILFSKKQIDRALYGTNISTSIINLSNILKSLERFVKIAECALRGYLSIELEIFVSVESILDDPTDLQLQVCVLESERLVDLINRDSALISSDLGLSSLSLAIPVHTYPTSGSSRFYLSMVLGLIALTNLFVLR